MGLTYFSLLLVNLLAFAISMGGDDWKDRGNTFAWLCPIFSVIALCLSGGIIWSSYTSYVDLRTTYDATVQQYATSIVMYNDKAVIDIESAALTDFKYQGYQPNIAKFVVDLRNVLTEYNKGFISKKRYSVNWFFGKLIIPPDDDMKVMSMKTAKDFKIKEGK